MRATLALLTVVLGSGPAAAAVSHAEAQAFADKKCMAEALYFESGWESEEGQIGVAEVILNRSRTPGFPKTVCKVIYENTFERVCQFSFACDGARVRPRSGAAWKRAWALATRIMNDPEAILAADTTKGALFFHADYVDPNWEETMGLEQTVQIGTHIFYRPKTAGGDEAATGASDDPQPE